MDRLGRPSTLGGYTLSFNYLITFVVYSVPCQRRVEKSTFLHDKGLRPGGYPEAALPSASFTATLSMPALRLVLGHQKVGSNCGIVQLMA